MKEQLFETWAKALSKYQQERFNTAFLDDIDTFEVSSGIIQIKVDRVLLECCMERFAKETGRTLKYLEIQFQNSPDEDIKDMLEISYFHQTNLKNFFSELRDAIVSQVNIYLLDHSVIDLVDEFEGQYSNPWEVVPNVQNAPFPDLDKYVLSFMATGE